MTNLDHQQLEDLCRRVELMPQDRRTDALCDLRRRLDALRSSGQRIPAWARETLTRVTEQDAEDLFDNMPV